MRKPILPWIMIAVFLGCLIVPPIYQFYYDTHALGWWELLDLISRPPTAENLKDFEKTLITNQRLGSWLRRTIGMAHGVKLHTAIPLPVIRGVDGVLFLREEIDDYRGFSLLDPPPAPTANLVHTIEDYHHQLDQRGIHLVVLPVPMKTMIYPELIWPEYRSSDGPAYPPTYQDFLSRLRNDGVDVLDVSQALWDAKSASGERLFLEDDTHWSLRGRKIAADALGDYIQRWLAGCEHIQFDIVETDFERGHDLTKMLEASDVWANGPTTIPAEGVYLHGKPLVAGDESPVLLLGDSYSWIGSKTGTGFNDDLMRKLQMSVQMFADIGNGMVGGCDLLQKHPTALPSKKIVVWEFAGRYMWGSPCPDLALPPVVK